MTDEEGHQIPRGAALAASGVAADAAVAAGGEEMLARDDGWAVNEQGEEGW